MIQLVERGDEQHSRHDHDLSWKLAMLAGKTWFQVLNT